jgi:hypothetical protein
VEKMADDGGSNVYISIRTISIIDLAAPLPALIAKRPHDDDLT